MGQQMAKDSEAFMLQSLNVINFWPGNSKGLPRKLGLGSNKARKAKLWWPRLPRKLGCDRAWQALPGRIFPVSLASLFQAGWVFGKAPDARAINS